MTVVNWSNTTPAPTPTGRLSPELFTFMRIQEFLLSGDELSPEIKAAIGILGGLAEGLKLQPMHQTTMLNIAAALNAAQRARDAATATKSEIPVLALDTGVRTDHALSGIAPAMALRAMPVMPSATPEQAIAAYTMQAVDGTLSKWSDGVNILTLIPVESSGEPTWSYVA